MVKRVIKSSISCEKELDAVLTRYHTPEAPCTKPPLRQHAMMFRTFLQLIASEQSNAHTVISKCSYSRKRSQLRLK